jgi:hypothetical protein
VLVSHVAPGGSSGPGYPWSAGMSAVCTVGEFYKYVNYYLY